MTTLLYFRGSNRKNDFLEQMVNKRLRLEYHRLNEEPVDKASIVEKKIKKRNFYLFTDLFNVKNLNQIDQLVYGDTIYGINYFI